MLTAHPRYLLLGLALIGWSGWTSFRGTYDQKVNEVRNVPKSIRDNPGAYRPLYAGYGRYLGGK